MKLTTEKYKGIAILVTKNIVGNNHQVVAKAKIRGMVGEGRAATKPEAVDKVKKWIDRIV